MYRRNCLKIRTEVAYFYIEMEYKLCQKQLSNKIQDKWWNVTLKKINVIVHGNGHYNNNNIRIESYGTTNNAHLPWSHRQLWIENVKFGGKIPRWICVCLCFLLLHFGKWKKKKNKNLKIEFIVWKDIAFNFEWLVKREMFLYFFRQLQSTISNNNHIINVMEPFLRYISVCLQSR